jgi:nucleotide-binding universal stress UspA family protein
VAVLDDILVPLDGSPLAEQALDQALELARLMEAQCSLLQVVGPGQPGEKAQAEAYLGRVAERLRGQGARARTQVVSARHVHEAILEQAEAQGNTLVALATHGRGGLGRLLLGSVASKLVQNATAPLLVYRPTDRGR